MPSICRELEYHANSPPSAGGKLSSPSNKYNISAMAANEGRERNREREGLTRSRSTDHGASWQTHGVILVGQSFGVSTLSGHMLRASPNPTEEPRIPPLADSKHLRCN